MAADGRPHVTLIAFNRFGLGAGPATLQAPRMTRAGLIGELNKPDAVHVPNCLATGMLVVAIVASPNQNRSSRHGSRVGVVKRFAGPISYGRSFVATKLERQR